MAMTWPMNSLLRLSSCGCTVMVTTAGGGGFGEPALCAPAGAESRSTRKAAAERCLKRDDADCLTRVRIGWRCADNEPAWCKFRLVLRCRMTCDHHAELPRSAAGNRLEIGLIVGTQDSIAHEPALCGH